MPIKIDLHYIEPRLVECYDADNPRGIDYDFYIQLAKDINAKQICDLGCGTGLLTRELASLGVSVTGIDPASAMLSYAKKQPNANLVNWIHGDSNVLKNLSADLILMTGNVAQVFLEESDWLMTLQNSYKALHPLGYIAFESRNPSVKAWEKWIPENTYERNQTSNGEMECWLDLISVKEGRVHFQAHNVFIETGETLIVDSTLRFRTEEEIRNALKDVGFTIKNVYGGWNYEPMSEESSRMVFVAQRFL